jgi:hypothetical protein
MKHSGGLIGSLTWTDCEYCKHNTGDGCEYADIIDEVELDLNLEGVKCLLFEEKEE